MVDVAVEGVTDPDGDAVDITITSVTDDEGSDPGDAGGIGMRTAQVRAERDGSGDGRTYTISFVASDGKGGESSDSVAVVVPHDKGKADGRAKPALVFNADNYPNPFNPATTIRYSLTEASDVRLVVYNVLGQAVRALVNAHQRAGMYQVVWDGRDASGQEVTSGVYLYRLKAGANVAIRKMVFAK